MASKTKSAAEVGEQVRRTVYNQLNKALTALCRKSKSTRSQDRSVHSARKRLKEVRALLRLVRADLGKTVFNRDNRALRDAARPLSEVRDATALIDTLDSLKKHKSSEWKKGGFGIVRNALRSRRVSIRRQILGTDALNQAASSVRIVHRRMNGWKLPHETWRSLKPGLRDTYTKGKEAMQIAHKNPTDEHLHEWRKRTKDLRNQLELLEHLWPAGLKPSAADARKLTDLLGEDHDLAVLRIVVDYEFSNIVPDDISQAFSALIARRRAELRASARSLGAKLFAETPARFVGRIS